jgi:hypothetical protein
MDPKFFKMKPLKTIAILFILGVIGLTACDFGTDEGDAKENTRYRVQLVVDGTARTFDFSNPMTVRQFLDEVEVETSPLDRVNPGLFTQITDGMTITIVRVTEEAECQEVPIGYDEVIRETINQEPGERTVARRGQDGSARVCEMVRYEDGVEVARDQTTRQILRDPVDQIVFIGVEDTLEPVAIEGTLAYISNGQATIIRNNSRNRQPLTVEGDLDGRVFDISADGRRLLFTRPTPETDDSSFANDLWVILDTLNPTPVQLALSDVLSAEWRPNNDLTFSYSTASAEGGLQGWTAFNDLYIMQIDSQSGQAVDVEVIIDVDEYKDFGSFPYWGTRFAWSPDGQKMAYAKSDGVGLVDLEEGGFSSYIIDFPHYELAIANGWVWQPTLAWSEDSQWVITTVHGPPYGEEDPINSIIFDVGIFNVNGSISIDNVLERTGIWASPSYSPMGTDEAGFQDWQIAYLQARNPLNSYSAEYDVMVADRDGSNPRTIFPPDGQPGLRPVDARDIEPVVWSPSGRQIAIVYQGDLWVVEVATGLAQQVTDDGQTQSVRWVAG